MVDSNIAQLFFYLRFVKVQIPLWSIVTCRGVLDDEARMKFKFLYGR